MKKELKLLAYYQLAGGLWGMFSTLYSWKLMGVLGVIIPIFFFAFSIYCGLLLLKGHGEKGLRLSLYNQLLQIPILSLLGVAYRFGAGVMLNTGINFISLESGISFRTFFNFSLSKINILIGGNENVLTIGVNIVAILLVLYINRMRRMDTAR